MRTARQKSFIIKEVMGAFHLPIRGKLSTGRTGRFLPRLFQCYDLPQSQQLPTIHKCLTIVEKCFNIKILSIVLLDILFADEN